MTQTPLSPYHAGFRQGELEPLVRRALASSPDAAALATVRAAFEQVATTLGRPAELERSPVGLRLELRVDELVVELLADAQGLAFVLHRAGEAERLAFDLGWKRVVWYRARAQERRIGELVARARDAAPEQRAAAMHELGAALIERARLFALPSDALSFEVDELRIDGPSCSLTPDPDAWASYHAQVDSPGFTAWLEVDGRAHELGSDLKLVDAAIERWDEDHRPEPEPEPEPEDDEEEDDDDDDDD